MYKTIATIAFLIKHVNKICMNKPFSCVRFYGFKGSVITYKILWLKDNFAETGALEHEIGHLATLPPSGRLDCVGTTPDKYCHIAETVADMVGCECLGANKMYALRRIEYLRADRNEI